MNEKLKDTFAYLIIGYIFFSWLLAFLLFCYEFIIGPMFNALSPQVTSSYSLLVKQINSSNISPSEKAFYLNTTESEYKTSIQMTPIPINQFIEDELILLVPSAILLGLIYYEAIKENNDE